MHVGVLGSVWFVVASFGFALCNLHVSPPSRVDLVGSYILAVALPLRHI